MDRQDTKDTRYLHVVVFATSLYSIVRLHFAGSGFDVTFRGELQFTALHFMLLTVIISITMYPFGWNRWTPKMPEGLLFLSWLFVVFGPYFIVGHEVHDVIIGFYLALMIFLGIGAMIFDAITSYL